MSRRFGFEPEAREIYLAQRKGPSNALYVEIRALLADLPADPRSRRVRQVRYRPDTWGARVRAGDVRRLALWRESSSDADLIEVHCLRPEPGES